MKKIIKKLANPLLIIAFSIVLRLVPHLPNFAPITAMALFGGVYLNKKYALLIPFLTMLVSDYLLLYINPFSSQPFHFNHVFPIWSLWYDNTIIAVYGSFLISGLIGLWLKNHKTFKNVVLATLFSSVQFFLVTNPAFCIPGAYNSSIFGLWQSY